MFGKSEVYTRPVLIIRKFSRFTFLGVPLTSKRKEREYYYPLHFKDKNVSALLDQIRTLDAKRLLNRISYLTDNQFGEIKSAIRDII